MAERIRLQAVGWAPADEVQALEVGDWIMWNFGSTSEVTKIETVSPMFLLISLQSTKTGERERPRKLKRTSLVARVPRKGGE
ncbi:hypothetical protein [Streptomyces himalayensis]|uniref:Uncharacterized protein n=1 Tax=Streptomyces himalayensis subsp. himalayensis TaxID=2756131 RepID=A0A7W0DUE5_9ACTN|nr:hypothetical protein [Streptomyces himalayensis]MBA2951415.1 hypothetical protein [Streptomyces himalayensis subsp. himalayensis]